MFVCTQLPNEYISRPEKRKQIIMSSDRPGYSGEWQDVFSPFSTQTASRQPSITGVSPLPMQRGITFNPNTGVTINPNPGVTINPVQDRPRTYSSVQPGSSVLPAKPSMTSASYERFAASALPPILSFPG